MVNSYRIRVSKVELLRLHVATAKSSHVYGAKAANLTCA